MSVLTPLLKTQHQRKKWLYGASLGLILAGGLGFSTGAFTTPAYALTNGNIVLNNGIITNSGAVEAGNPEGRVFCIDVSTSLSTGAVADLSNTGANAAGLTWATMSATQRFQI